MLGTNKQSISFAVGVKGSCFGRGTENHDSALRVNCKTNATQALSHLLSHLEMTNSLFSRRPFPWGLVDEIFWKKDLKDKLKSLSKETPVSCLEYRCYHCGKRDLRLLPDCTFANIALTSDI